MKIRERYTKFTQEVYVVYWAEYQGKRERYHCVIPEDGYPGFISVPESECDLVDPSLNGLVITNLGEGRDVLMNPVLADDNFLYQRLIDHDPGAMREFLSILSSKPATK